MAKATGTAQTTTLVIGDMKVELVRKRVRNINLRVRRDGTVRVSAPLRVSQAQVEAFVASKRAWIERARERASAQGETMQSHCVEGATVVVWGRPLTCHLVPQDILGSRTACSFEVVGDQLVARVRPQAAGSDETATVTRDQALDRWLRELLVQAADEALPSCEALVGRHCTQLRLRRMKSRWGSCNVRTGAVTLGADLVHFPKRCLVYVLVHELTHLHEPTHNARFHALMDTFLPDWRETRELLNSR